MRDLLEQEIRICREYLATEGDNEIDIPYYEGRIAALEWVIRQLSEEG